MAAQELADERQIRNLVERLAHRADYGDLGEYTTLFTGDAVREFADGRMSDDGRHP